MEILNSSQSYCQFNSVSILARLNRTRAHCTWRNACWAATRAKAANCHPPHKFRAAAMFPRAATASNFYHTGLVTKVPINLNLS
jgi:hypothetical protein